MYEERARGLLATGALSNLVEGEWRLDAKLTPGYPAFVAAVYAVFGPRPLAVVATQVLLGVFGVMLVFWLGRVIVGPRAALAAAMLLAVETLLITRSTYVMTEALFTFTLALAVLLILVGVKRRSNGVMVLGGAALGIAALTRPIGLAGSPFLLLALLIAHPHERRAAVAQLLFVVIGIAVVLSPWLVRNVVYFSAPELTSMTGQHLYYWWAGPAIARAEGQPYTGAFVDELARRHPIRHIEEAYDSPRDQFLRSRALRGQAVRAIARYPDEFALACARGWLEALLGPGRTAYRSALGHPTLASGCAVVGYLIWLGILVLAVSGGMLLLRQQPLQFVPAVLWTASAALILANGPAAHARFRVPAVPLLCLLAGYAWAHYRGRPTASRDGEDRLCRE